MGKTGVRAVLPFTCCLSRAATGWAKRQFPEKEEGGGGTEPNPTGTKNGRVWIRKLQRFPSLTASHSMGSPYNVAVAQIEQVNVQDGRKGMSGGSDHSTQTIVARSESRIDRAWKAAKTDKSRWMSKRAWRRMRQ